MSVVVFALFAALAIVLAHPERWHRPASPAAAATETSTTVTQKAPGVAEIEVQRGGGKQTYRLRQVGKQVVVEHASPPESARKGWWARQWDRLRGR